LRATLHALRDRLTVEEVAQLGAQLPMLIRGFYYEGWDPTGKPLRERHEEQFLVRISREFSDDASMQAVLRYLESVALIRTFTVIDPDLKNPRRSTGSGLSASSICCCRRRGLDSA
jgi:hypothetical protein